MRWRRERSLEVTWGGGGGVRRRSKVRVVFSWSVEVQVEKEVMKRRRGRYERVEGAGFGGRLDTQNNSSNLACLWTDQRYTLNGEQGVAYYPC